MGGLLQSFIRGQFKYRVNRSEEKLLNECDNCLVNSAVTLNFFSDEVAYPMSFHRKGIALIISNKHFERTTGLETRHGTNIDAQLLEDVLSRLGFDVMLYCDLRAIEMIKVLSFTAADTCHQNNDCFMCAILTHGENGVMYGIDRSIAVDQLTEPFKRAKGLIGKPKIFIFQACRGDKLMPGVDRNGLAFEFDDIANYSTPRIPLEADILLIYVD
ncbi:hypothetical protein ACOME3_010335 [Neoechinorhynchus agilis]